MPSFQDSAVLVILALLLFGPKKLPVLARQLGKLMAEFRRASNEFRSQMEEELRASEQADRQKKLAAIQAAAPPMPALDPTPEQAQLSAAVNDSDASSYAASDFDPEVPAEYPDESVTDLGHEDYAAIHPDSHADLAQKPHPAPPQPAEPASAPLPIASVGEYSIMPPATGLPLARSTPAVAPESAVPPPEAELETETLHG